MVRGLAMFLALSLVSLGSAGGQFGTKSAQACSDTPNDFVYQLQNIDPDRVENTQFDLVIIDYSRDGCDEEKFSAAEIEGLKNSPGGQKTVLPYMSTGEVEDYRWYWQRSWDKNRDGKPDAGTPERLGRSTPTGRATARFATGILPGNR